MFLGQDPFPVTANPTGNDHRTEAKTHRVRRGSGNKRTDLQRNKHAK